MTENNCSQCTGSGAGKAEGLSKQTEADQFLKQNSMKQYFIGTLAVILAIAASAFTIISSNKAVGDVFGDIGSGSSQYQKLTTAYNSALCDQAQTDTCAYKITASGASHVTGTQYSAAQIQSFRASGWLEPLDNNKGTYSGD